MTATAPSTQIDTRVMTLIHTYYRRETRLGGGLIRAVRAGDIRRARVVADHLSMVGRHLHHHHETEDRLLWPLLLERVPDELAPIVHLMEAQHAAVGLLQGRIAVHLPLWREDPAEDRGELLAGLHDRLYGHLAEHLDAEEQRLLPVAARTLTQAEWDAMGQEGRAGTRRGETSLTLGMFAYEGDPAVLQDLLADAPAPVRRVVLFLARRAFVRHATRIHGTSNP